MRNKTLYQKTKEKISVIVIILLALVFVNGMQINADVGNVYLDFNWQGDDSIGHKRANLANDFRIFFRINEDILSYDWVKVWFPIDEASCDPADICGDEFVIKGQDESPRFVPNEKYFEKYDNKAEESVGKLYNLTGERKVDTEFFEPTLCEEPEGNCRMIEDSSGLGYWMMGTVMPSLPKDESEREIYAEDIINSTMIGYNPCGTHAYPTLVQTCNGRSFKTYSSMQVEAWRQGYNPIDWNFSQKTGIIFPATPGRYRVRLATAAEPTPVESESFVLPCSKITKPVFMRYKHEMDAKGAYTVKFNVGEGGALDRECSKITLKFPDCISVRIKSSYNLITINGERATKRPEYTSKTLSIISSVDVDNFGDVEIVFPDDWITNKCKEPFTVSVMTSSEPEFVESEPLDETIATGIWVGDVKLTNNNAYAVSGYRFDLRFPKDCQLEIGDEICIEFPRYTKIPDSIDTEDITIQDKYPTEVYINPDGLLCFTLPIKTYFGTVYFIKLSERIGIQNTYIAGAYKLHVSTKCSEIPALSKYFEIRRIPLKSTLVFTSPDEPNGCGGWYKSPPVMEIICNNPEARVFFWYDSKEESQVIYTGPKRLAPGSYRSTIHYYAEYGGEIESPKSKQLFLDIVPPAIKIHTPEKKKVLTNQLTYVIKGERDFVEMLTDGKASHLVADGVAYSLNDSEFKTIIESRIFPETEGDKISHEWEQIIKPLKEGENILRIRMFDQACNEKIEHYTIICDTVPPEFEIVEPLGFDDIESMSSFDIILETEAGATVEVNGKLIPPITNNTESNKSRHRTTMEVENEIKLIEIKVSDKAGNHTEETIEIIPKRKPITIRLQIDSKELFVDGKTSLMDIAPILSSPPLPRDLAGNTFVPLRAVLEALGANVEWVSETKHITVTMSDIDKKIILQVGNTKAYINTERVDIKSSDGKTLLYPVIVNSRTLIPLRFVVESIGANVEWNAEDKSITITY